MTDSPPTYVETRQEAVGAAPVGAASVAPAAPAYPQGYVEVERSAPAAYAGRASTYVSGTPGYRAIQLIGLALAVIETVIALRIAFAAFGANQNSGFVSFINAVAAPFVAPFRGIFSDYQLGNTGILEVGSIVAMVIWALVAVGLIKLVRILATPRPAAV